MDMFDRDFKRITRWGIGVWVTVLAINVALLAVVVWAVIKLVNHFA
jgi:hypothetical protein